MTAAKKHNEKDENDMAEEYLTTQEAVALNMAAKHGSKVRGKLEGVFRASRNKYVKNVGTILILQAAEAKNPYLVEAQRLAEEVATKKPIRIDILAMPAQANRRSFSPQHTPKPSSPLAYSHRFLRPA